MKFLVLLFALVALTGSPAFCQDLKPELKSEDVVIQNTFKNTMPNVQSIAVDERGQSVLAAKSVDLDDLSNVVAAKEQKRKARVEANRQSDLQYKAIPNKPSRWRHPAKRTDLWIDYHQDTMRKYRTRVLPIGQGIATVLGMGFAAGAAFR